MIFRDPTCPYGAVIVAVVVCVDVYYILYNIIITAHTRMIHHHSKDKLSLQTQMMYSTPFLLRVLGLLWLVPGLLGLLSVSALLKAQLPRSPSVVVSRGLVPLGWAIEGRRPSCLRRRRRKFCCLRSPSKIPPVCLWPCTVKWWVLWTKETPNPT